MAEIKPGCICDWFFVGDSLNKVYTTIQENGHIFGLATMIIPEKNLDKNQEESPIWLCMVDSGLKI